MKKMIVAAIFSLFLFMACSHDKKIDVAKEKEAMKQADIGFSNLSKKKGMKEAFLQYMDSAAVLLRPNHSPVKGRDAMQLIWGINDFDEAHTLPYTSDLVRLASSAHLAIVAGHLSLKASQASNAILAPKPMPPLSPPWKMSWTCMPAHTIPSVR